MKQLNFLSKTKWLLVPLMLLTLSVGQMWGTVVSGTTYNTKSSVPSGWSKNGDFNSSNYIKLIATTNYVQTESFTASSFSSIKIKARTFGGPTGNQAQITVSWWVGNSETVLGTVTPSNTTLTDLTISSPTSLSSTSTGYIKISCKNSADSKGAGVSEITLNFSANGGGGGGGGSVTRGKDILNRTLTGVTGTSYTNWSDKSYTETGHSSAVYKGNSAGGNSSIQLRSDNSTSGIITTTSGGNATKVVVDWNSSTTNGRTIDIYGKNTAYSAASDLYGNNKGTKIGSIVKGTSTELNLTGNYQYIGIRSNSGALYMNSISITWGYTVTYNGNGNTSGSVPTDGTYYDNNATVTVKTNSGSLAKTGYTFGGWNTKANGSGTNRAASSTYSITSHDTLYAKWTPKQYTINYNDQGNVAFSGTHASGYPTTHTYGTATTLKTATKTGYDFGGWFANQNCTGSAVTSLGATAYTANITLYAKWTPKQYTITYKDKNNADFSGTHASGYPTKHTYGTATTLSTATKTGYDFGGWFTAAACTGSAVTSLGATAYTASPTVYALWTPTVYTITYEGLSGASNSNPEEYTIETATITLAAPGARSGYTFAGWTCGGNPITQITIGSTGNKTITATWTANQYSITYKDQGNEDYSGSNGGSLPAKHTYDTQTNLVNGSKTGYTFSGWYANQNCTGDAVTSLAADGYTDDITLYAKWTANTYYVRFNKNNDDAEGTMSNQEFTYDVSQELSKNTFSLANKNFKGWATEENGDVEYDDEAEVDNLTTANNGIVDLYAVWVANTHTVTYVANDKTSGTVPTDNTTYNHNATVTVLGGGDLAKTHYAFAGWTDGVNNYIEGSTFAITDDVTLSARWACDEVVTVAKAASTDHGSFTLDKSGELATCDAAVVVTVTPSANTGYEFSAITQTGLNSGVTINQNAKTVTYDQNTSGSSEINVTFAAKHITVTWNVNGGDDLAQGTSEYIYDGDGVTPPTPTRTGYDFDGWYTEDEGGDPIDNVGGANKPSADVEYYAHWNVKSYAVKWMISGTEWATDGQTSVNYGSSVTDLPTPPDPADYCGDKFMGWTTDAVYTHNTSPLYTTMFPNATGAQTFYAVFADYTK